MKKNGFTLIELIAVIVILALLVTVAVPSAISIANKMKINMYCSKVTTIEEAAKLYGQDVYGDTVPDNTNVKISSLVKDGYIKKDVDGCSLESSTNPCVTDPRDSSSLDTATIHIYNKPEVKNRIFATYNFNTHNSESSDICN